MGRPGRRSGIRRKKIAQRQRPANLAWQFSRVLAGHRGETTLVYSHCAPQDGREQAPAPLVQQEAEHVAITEIPLGGGGPGPGPGQGRGSVSCLPRGWQRALGAGGFPRAGCRGARC